MDGGLVVFAALLRDLFAEAGYKKDRVGFGFGSRNSTLSFSMMMKVISLNAVGRCHMPLKARAIRRRGGAFYWEGNGLDILVFQCFHRAVFFKLGVGVEHGAEHHDEYRQGGDGEVNPG